jgi:hypothetical protein
MSSSIVQSLTSLLSGSPDEILSWMIDIRIENQSASDSNCNTIIYDPPKSSQGMRNNVGLTFSVGDPTPQFTFDIEQDNYNW